MKTLSVKKCLFVIGVYFIISKLLVLLIPETLVSDNSFIYFELAIELLIASLIFFITKDELRGEFNVFKAELLTNLKYIGTTTFKMYLICELISFIAVFIFFGIFGIPVSNNSNSETVMFLIGNNTFLMIILAVIIGPFTEEVLFRGAIFKLISKYNEEFAVVITALLFAIIHFQADIFAKTINANMIPSLIAYLALSYAITNNYYHNRNIINSIGIHALYNFINVIISLILL